MDHLLDELAHIYVLTLHDSLHTCLYPYGGWRGGEKKNIWLNTFFLLFSPIEVFQGMCIVCTFPKLCF